MLHKTNGIILHTTNYTDTSLIVKVYTESFGLQSYMINGVRGKKSKNKASLFQPMALVTLVVSNSEKSTLQRISEISIDYPYSDIPFNIIKSSITMFINEVLYRSLKEQHADEDLYHYIKNSLQILDLKTDSVSNFHLLFLVQLSRFLGFFPQGSYSATTSHFDLNEGRFTDKLPLHRSYLSPELSRILDELIRSNYENLHELLITRNQRKEIIKGLILFYQFHISAFGEIRSLEVLEEVVS